MGLTRRILAYSLLYFLGLTIGVMIIHEALHVLTAVALGVPLGEMTLGLYWMNPSVTFPEWFVGTHRTIAYYAGGLVTGVMLLALYFLHWFRKYRHDPTPLVWFLGLVTIILAGWQLSNGYLEGQYHAAYVIGADSLLSPSNLFMACYIVAAAFLHLALNPISRMKRANASRGGGCLGYVARKVNQMRKRGSS